MKEENFNVDNIGIGNDDGRGDNDDDKCRHSSSTLTAPLPHSTLTTREPSVVFAACSHRSSASSSDPVAHHRGGEETDDRRGPSLRAKTAGSNHKNKNKNKAKVGLARRSNHKNNSFEKCFIHLSQALGVQE
ncbi:uncharacterized protein DS421_15g504850 [Arachis hypogaea]|nr:uncharacterized protein DS421_15g504850 [Arachis hypogaea]